MDSNDYLYSTLHNYKNLIPLYNDKITLKSPEEELDHIKSFKKLFKKGLVHYDRNELVGHFTSSALIVNEDLTKILLTHHKKLDLWLQMGGHVDGSRNFLDTAIREAEEESGLKTFTPLDPYALLEGPSTELICPIDIDIHQIPEYKDQKEHYHFDFRYLLQTSSETPLILSDESHEIAWVEWEDVYDLSRDQSLLTLIEKAFYIFGIEFDEA